jgi:SAM-dependent methyltransferase
MTDRKSPDLDAAYALTTPQDSVRLYADWATDYDAGFAQEQDYRLPAAVARAFCNAAGKGANVSSDLSPATCTPVLDVGAGTGLVAEHLSHTGVIPIDGIDISDDMLAIAGEKGLYRSLINADLTKKLPLPLAAYGGIVSAGTFTTGHVGPEVLRPLLSVGRPGAICALSISAAHYVAQGFSAELDRLSQDAIANLTLIETPIYGPKAVGDHRNDRAIIAVFSIR